MIILFIIMMMIIINIIIVILGATGDTSPLTPGGRAFAALIIIIAQHNLGEPYLGPPSLEAYMSYVLISPLTPGGRAFAAFVRSTLLMRASAKYNLSELLRVSRRLSLALVTRRVLLKEKL